MAGVVRIGPGKALPDEARDEAAVIEVGVGQEQEIYPVGRDRKGIPIPCEERPLLIETAIDEDGQPRRLPGRSRSRSPVGPRRGNGVSSGSEDPVEIEFRGKEKDLGPDPG